MEMTRPALFIDFMLGKDQLRPERKAKNGSVWIDYTDRHQLEPLLSSTTSLSPLLNDKTLNWSASEAGPWLNKSTTKRESPPAILILTTFGWNQVNQTAGLDIYRSIRTRELIQGIVHHPWFHPTAWDDLNTGKLQVSNETWILVFLDRETCGEKNYPKYNGGIYHNRDTIGGRGNCCGRNEHFIHEVMNSTVMRFSSRAKFVLFECGGYGPKPHFQLDRTLYNTSKLVFASISALHQQHQPQDLGLPPPAPHPYVLAEKQRNDIGSCQDELNRTVLLSFVGNYRNPVRRQLAKLHNGKDIVMAKTQGIQASGFLHDLALRSRFSACPRGDNLFSYRLTEVMSCGSIPVIYADHWVLPFTPLLLDWSQAAVIIPEDKANETLTILQNISIEEQCRRRERIVQIYDQYMKTPEGTISGIVESILLQ